MKHTPRKRFGQNFLKDSTVLEAILTAIAPRANDFIIEIGPGLGALTRLLLRALPQLHVIELDRDLVARLRQTWPTDNLIIHQGDALRFDFSRIADDRKIRVVGNLPYNISTPLLFHLASFIRHIEDQHFMLQKEVVERMIAAPGSKTYGRLSVMLQWQYHMDMLFTVPPDAFTPQPKVNSAIVRMIPRKHPAACDAGKLEKTVAQAFSQRRKILRNTLAPLFGEQELIDIGIDPAKRPEDITPEQFISLANLLP
ncbi:MAG: 16S rRNA (adenine(1518)-N(6)/adenine(1519)-N(6))-dimethyltransferase RsmA [Burkholderiaceae bacterium]|jgi:16S rRNA (adenine1518-N6/adenine1519-N6)-dimethyltransferase|nr:16S rRNA (adenine(1518)-N(6)/adenine(1519)-N(6))-dimethyltransferase RsmA [Burkholderiaceae bacterium]